MRNVEDYRENARACRETAMKFDGEVREQLLKMAKEWEYLAEQREQFLAERGALTGDKG